MFSLDEGLFQIRIQATAPVLAGHDLELENGPGLYRVADHLRQKLK